MTSSSSTCVLRAHKLDDGTLEVLERLRADLGRERVFVLFDDTRGGWSRRDFHPGLTEGVDLLVLTDDDCERANSMHRRGYGHDAASWTFWHPEAAMVLMHEWLSERLPADRTEHVWFVEYDVRCQGSFRDVLARCDQVQADFMACGRDNGDQTRLRLATEDPGWCWWHNGLEGEIRQLPQSTWVGCFFPVVRLSRAAVAALRASFGRSTGFCEVYVSTLVATTPGLIAAPIPSDALGIFRYLPAISCDEWERIAATDAGTGQARLFHPVK